MAEPESTSGSLPIRRAASGVSDGLKKLLLYILYIVSIVFLLPRARGARPPQGPGDPPWEPVKNNVFPCILEGFGRKPSNYQRAGPWRKLALVGVP